MTDLPAVPGDDNPFDALRQVRDDGSEFWSARDLMPYMEYTKWQKFSPVIMRAICAAENMQIDVSANFTLAGRVSGKRGPAQEDVHLSRYGAYLVGMNGDPSKPSVAALQTYFTVKTREAEVQRTALTEDEIIHQALSITARRVGELEAKVEVLAAENEVLEAEVEIMTPKAAAYDAFIDTRNFLDLDQVSDLIGWGSNLLRAQMRRLKILKEGGPSHNLPYARYEGRFKTVPWTKEISNGRAISGLRPLLDPNEVDWLRLKVGDFKDRPKDLMQRNPIAPVTHLFSSK